MLILYGEPFRSQKGRALRGNLFSEGEKRISATIPLASFRSSLKSLKKIHKLKMYHYLKEKDFLFDCNRKLYKNEVSS